MCAMGVAPPPAVPAGVINRIRSDLRSSRAARGQVAAGRAVLQPGAHARVRARPAAAAAAHATSEYGPVFTMRLLYLPIVFVLGPEANHYMTVSHASNFRWRDGAWAT